MLWHDIWVGVLSNVASVVVVGAPASAWYLVVRRRRLAFFGLRDTRRVTLYASRLYVPSGASVGPDGRPRTFQGIATPDYESTLIASIEGFFAGLARLWRRTGLRWGDIDVQALVSPAAKEGIDREAILIAIGSPGYNVVSGMVEEDLGSLVRFANDNRDLVAADGMPVGDAACCFVQRVTSQTTGQVVFYVAGPAAEGTTAAVNYLLRNWRQLAKRYRSGRSFCVVLRLTGAEQYTVVRRLTDGSDGG
jgi:hypothetical protein